MGVDRPGHYKMLKWKRAAFCKRIWNNTRVSNVKNPHICNEQFIEYTRYTL